MNRTRQARDCMGALLALLLLACGGGSGSTGLILPEGALMDEVRETGECREANETTYCFSPLTDESDFGPGAPPDPTLPEPCPDDSCPIESAIYTFDAIGIEADSTCVIATRGADGDWILGEPMGVGRETSSYDVVVSPELAVESGGSLEAALLCFEAGSENELPPSVTTLAEAEPRIIYVAPRL